ncbi:MAG: phosphodiester glycosidase family protein [Eubacteriales bacterium]|nr:phosphodiester glycosidase family protein [Eubacteriales bacterium]
MQEDEFNLDIDSILAEFSSEEKEKEGKSENTENIENRREVFPSDSTIVFRPEPEKITHFAEKYKKEPEKKKREKAERRSEEKPVPKKERTEKKPSGKGSHVILTLLGMLLTLFCLVFSLIVIHPAIGTSSSRAPEKEESISGKINDYISSSAAAKLLAMQKTEAQSAARTDVQEDIVPEKIRYSIPESDLVAPVPDPACFGSVMPDNAEEIMNIIQRARENGLLEDQEMIFSLDTDFRSDTAIRYYLDETLLVICWKEIIDGNTCSCVEVKMADASQFRRKFADDAFGASNTYYATDLSRSVNSVVAMNADYYLFRDFGIVAFNRELYRFNESVYSGDYKKYNCVDTCFVTENGNLLYFKRGEVTTEEEMRRYIEDNNIIFSIAFGPVLVENSEAEYIDWYPVGEIDKGYSRAGIGQVDSLHYFYMSLNHSNEKQARWNINTFAQHFAEKGVQTAYALDGGQTSEIVFQGEPYNYIDFGAERLVSDIIYFASAIPSGEVSG